MRVAGGRGVMKTRRGSSRRSWRAAIRSVPWLDGMDCRRSSCLAGGVNCEMPRLRSSEADELQFVPAVVDAASSDACSPSTQSAAVQGRAWRGNDRGRDRRRDGPGRPRRGRKDGDGGAACVEGRRVIGPTGAVRVMVATKPVDFRKGAEGLAALVRETMTADPFSGAVYVFRAKRADRIKLIFWDGTGLCLFAKRLEDGIFRWPKIEDGVMRLSAAQLSALLEGLDWRRVHAARETVTPTQPG